MPGTEWYVVPHTIKCEAQLVKRLATMQEIENLQQLEDRDAQSMSNDGDMEELGKVFLVPKTGKMLMN